MIPQYVAAALVSENKVLAHPACVDSIPTSAGQEDHVSMEAAFLELSGNYYVCWGEYEKAKVLMARSMKISREYSFHMTYIHCLANMGHFYLQTDNAAELMSISSIAVFVMFIAPASTSSGSPIQV